MSIAVKAYISAIVVAAAASAAVLYSIAPDYQTQTVSAAVWLSAFGVLAYFVTFRLPAGATGSIAFIPFIAAACLSPNWVAVVAISIAMAITQVANQQRVIKTLFNVAQTSLATSLGIISYQALGGVSFLSYSSSSLVETSGSSIPPFLALVTVFFSANTLAVSGVISLSERIGIVQVWRRNTLSSLAYDLLASPVVYILAWIFVKFGPIGAALLAVPMLGLRQLYSTNLKLEQVNEELLQLMVKAIEARDPYTSGHSRRVAHYSKIISRAIGLGTKEVEHVGTAALLHDVGKIHEIYAPILRKPDKLTADEWAIIQTHPIKSAELVATVSHLKDIVAPLRHHHENWDGTGYPDGISGESIPLAARIIIFADTVDAMTTDRPYRKALGELEVKAELVRCRAKQFDPNICDRLLASPMFGFLFAPASREVTPAFNPVVASSPPSRFALRK